LIRSRETLDYLRGKYADDVDVVSVLDEVVTRRQVDGLVSPEVEGYPCAECGTLFSEVGRSVQCAGLDRDIDASAGRLRTSTPANAAA
jgi:hypothetical protein